VDIEVSSPFRPQKVNDKLVNHSWLLLTVKSFSPLISSQLSQPLIVYAKVMGYLVSEGAMDHPASIFRGARVDLYRTLVDADSIWQDQAIVMGALCLRDAVVKAQQVCGRTYPCSEHNLLAGPIFDYNFNVVEFIQKDVR
jgi:hypothetical protein